MTTIRMIVFNKTHLRFFKEIGLLGGAGLGPDTDPLRLAMSGFWAAGGGFGLAAGGGAGVSG